MFMHVFAALPAEFFYVTYTGIVSIELHSLKKYDTKNNQPMLAKIR
jgi:hypothetical protein